MPTIALGTDLTLAELIRREDPDGKLAQLIDLLNEENRILEDMTFIECNNGTYHEDTATVSEPTGEERAYDQGVSKEAGVTEKITEPTCMLNGLSEVDRAKLKHCPDEAAGRLQEDGFFLRGMTKTMVSRLFDGDRSTDTRRINGINNRSDYNTLTGTTNQVFDNVSIVDAANTCADASTFTSIYCIQWGFKKVNLIYPRNDPQGGGELPIKMEDFGLNIINQSGTSETKKYPAWQTWFGCDFGMFIHDYRCIKRICNIATSSVDTGVAGARYTGFHEDPLIEMYNQLEYGGAGAVMYCNRTVLTQAQKRANEKGNAYFSMEMEGEGPFAKPVTRFMGIEMKRVDQITNTQDDIT